MSQPGDTIHMTTGRLPVHYYETGEHMIRCPYCADKFPLGTVHSNARARSVQLSGAIERCHCMACDRRFVKVMQRLNIVTILYKPLSND